jgi:hypothetical protein
MSFEDMTSATSSPESAGGHSQCNSLVFRQQSLFGPEAVPASHLVLRESEKASKTTGTCGQSSGVSSMKGNLQQCLENRLRQRMEGIGSPLYGLTWKHWDMKSGQRICALRASVRRTSGNGCSGWPTATSTDAVKGGKISPRKNMMGLSEMVHQAGWPTAAARDWKNGKSNQHGKNSRPLNEVAMLTGWPTAKATDGSKGSRTTAGAIRELERKGNLDDLPGMAAISSSSHAETEKPGQLSPVFVCWLMGYPAEWLNCVDWATLSSRKSRRSSSEPRGIQSVEKIRN